MRKFEDVIPITDWEILTPDGWVNCTKIMKTIPYEKWIIEFDCGTKLECADTHIVILESNSEVFVKDLIIGDIVKSIKGTSKVISITNTTEYENMYDVEVDSNSHQYYSNGIVSHNTTTAAAYLLYEVIFNSNKSIGILANKGATSAEILDRLCKMFEELPWFLKPGVVTWNKTSISLANGSKCFSAATSSSSIRGKSVGTLYCVTGDTEIELLVNDLNKITTTIADAYDSLIDNTKADVNERDDDIFIKNKYYYWYFDIINNAKTRTLEKNIKTEKHHIIPRSITNDNTKENLVKLTLREHFIVHRLLIKILSGKNKAKMVYAMFLMCNLSDFKIPAKEYERIKCLRSSSISETLKGRKLSQERINKVNKNPEKIRKTAEAHRGMKRSVESKQRMSLAKKGYIPSNIGKVECYNIETGKLAISMLMAFQMGWVHGSNRSEYSKERIASISATMTGTINVFDIETKTTHRVSKEQYHELKGVKYFNLNSKVYKEWKNVQ